MLIYVQYFIRALRVHLLFQHLIISQSFHIFYSNETKIIFCEIKFCSWIFKVLRKLHLFGDNFLSIHKHSLGSYVRSHIKFGTNFFSWFDVYWIQTDKQTDRHPGKKITYLDYLNNLEFKRRNATLSTLFIYLFFFLIIYNLWLLRIFEVDLK